MKKLMIAAIAVAFAAVAQAASVTWSQYGLGSYGNPEAEYEGATIYLMSGDATVASAFIETVIGAGSDYASVFNNSISGAVTSIVYGEEYTADLTASLTPGASYDLFTVVLDEANNGVYVSDIVSGTVVTVGDTDFIFEASGSYESPFAAGVKDYDAAVGGWYTASTSSVPEPTSALMLLVGLAGLALKRKVA